MKFYSDEGVRVQVEKDRNAVGTAALLGTETQKLAVILDWKCEGSSGILAEVKESHQGQCRTHYGAPVGQYLAVDVSATVTIKNVVLWEVAPCITPQKTTFFIVTAVKISNFTNCNCRTVTASLKKGVGSPARCEEAPWRVTCSTYITNDATVLRTRQRRSTFKIWVISID
jgi:hypothetical protein